MAGGATRETAGEQTGAWVVYFVLRFTAGCKQFDTWKGQFTSKTPQLCDDTRDTVLIENNGVTQKWVATPFWSDSIVFHENTIASIITDADAWCKRALMVYSHCMGLVQGPNRKYSTMWKCSHWSETGTGAIVFYCASPFPCTCSVPVSVQCEYTTRQIR